MEGAGVDGVERVEMKASRSAVLWRERGSSWKTEEEVRRWSIRPFVVKSLLL
jgi:hypothetical protein